MTGSLAEKMVESGGEGQKVKILGYITAPVVKSIITIDKNVLDEWAALKPNQTSNHTSLLSSKGGYLFSSNTGLSDQATGGILLGLSLLILVGSLMVMVKILNSLLQGSMAETVKKIVNPKFGNPIIQYLFGYVLMLVGVGATIVMQSSSIFTSTLTPMVGMGYVEIETCYPMFLGSNIGTTFTSMLAALTQSGTDNFKETVQGSLVHLFFNVIGIILFYPVPFMRFPIPLCKKLGKVTARYRWVALVYIVGMFFLLPGIFVALTLIDRSNILMYTVLGITVFLAIVIGTINFMQGHDTLQNYLPKVLLSWDFLPEPCRSLEPYDRCVNYLLHRRF